MATEKTRPEDVEPDAPPSAEEIAAADELRAALEDPAKVSPDAELLRAVANAHAPRDIDPVAHRAIVERALAKAPRPKPEQGRVIRVTFVAAGVLAAAALVLLFIRTRFPPPQSSGTTSVSAEVAVTRSTQPLFPEPFAAEGGESARIDRIAMAREADLRENRFARWGVR